MIARGSLFVEFSSRHHAVQVRSVHRTRPSRSGPLQMLRRLIGLPVRPWPSACHHTGCERGSSSAHSGEVMAGAPESGLQVGDRHSHISGHTGSTGGRDGAHPVFQPGNGCEMNDQVRPNGGVRARIARSTGPSWCTAQSCFRLSEHVIRIMPARSSASSVAACAARRACGHGTGAVAASPSHKRRAASNARDHRVRRVSAPSPSGRA